LTKVNRWAGFGIGTNHLTHLEQNLEVLTRGKSDNIGKFFNVDKLRGIANPNFLKFSHQEKRKKRYEHERIETRYAQLEWAKKN